MFIENLIINVSKLQSQCFMCRDLIETAFKYIKKK